MIFTQQMQCNTPNRMYVLRTRFGAVTQNQIPSPPKCWLFAWLATWIKITLGQLSVALTVFEIFIFQNSWPWKCRSKSWCSTFAVAPIDSKYRTIYDGNSNVCSISLYEIFTNQMQSLTLKMKAKVKEKKNGSCAIRL